MDEDDDPHRRAVEHFFALLGIAGACLASGCIAGDPEADEESDGRFGIAQQRQIDGGTKVWRQITLIFNDASHTPLATIYVFNTALGSYQTGKEYWFVNLNGTSLVGRYGLTISAVDQSSTTAPPDPGYSSEQSFTLGENVSWGSGWTSDPVPGGSLYNGPNHLALRLFKSTATPATLTEITWYQAIPSGNTAVNITPSGTFSIGGSAFQVPSGDFGYDVDQRTF